VEASSAEIEQGRGILGIVDPQGQGCEGRGVAVLAQPLLCVNLLPELVEGGLEGLEAHYNGYEPYEVNYLTGLAHKYGLIVTGGSDFHGPSVLPSVKMGQAWVTMDVVEKLRERAHRQRPPRQG